MANQEKIDLLKEEATALGISFAGNIGEKSLAKKIATFKALNSEDTVDLTPEPHVKTTPKVRTKADIKKEMSALVRFKMTCNDPQFKKHKGIMKAAGSTTFFAKKFIPFNTVWHAPRVIFDALSNQKYQWFEELRNPATGRKYKVSRTSNAFVMEELPALTQAELDELATEQKLNNSID